MAARTTPKHGKRLENRLYSSIRRGSPVSGKDSAGGMNPDGSIEVAAVCENQVRVYATAKAGRRLLESNEFAHHGAAVLFATEHDETQRAMRSRQG